jgi:type II secretory pathway pseudopilin PulG
MLTEYMNKKKHFIFGFSLIESLIAFMLLGVIGGAVVYILAQVVSVTKAADLKAQGASYANQGTEAVRDYYQVNRWLALSGRDPNGGSATCYNNTSLSDPSSPCKADYTACTGSLACESLTGGFYRQISVLTEIGTPSKVTVTVNVYWLEKGKKQSTKVDAVFFNY